MNQESDPGRSHQRVFKQTRVARGLGPRWRQMLLLVLIASLVPSCALRRLKQNVQQINARGIISVTVSPLAGTAPTYALALSPSNGTNRMVGFQPVGPSGAAMFLLLGNRHYSVGAFTDLNTNGIYDGGEPIAYVRDVRPTPLSDTTQHRLPLALTLSATNGLPRGQSMALPRRDEELGEALTVKSGEIANLDEPKFSAEVGEMGMWRPFEFLQQYGYGIYFLEPYDPHKLPVLFVYGIAGSFQEWRPVVEKMDRRKYQPWFFQYPSGVRLDKSARGLAGLLLLLRQQYRFERMAVVAHSMGGLVSRGAIQRAVNQAGTNFIPNFITISTPWGGHEAAELGVKHLDFPVPSWYDMATGSDYLKEILARPLPPGTRHDLIFGFKHKSGLGLPDDNDGTVGVESELVHQVQEEAASVFGLHLDHNEILRSPIVLRKIEQTLAR